jgi:hypothetical protein
MGLFRKKDLDDELLKTEEKKRYSTRTPIRILIGTCPGSRKDTEAIARAQIERYFDIPEKSWFFIRKSKGDGYYYEIHEGGAGFAYLPSVVEYLSGTKTSVILKGTDKKAIEVHRRIGDQILHSIVMSEQQSEALEQPDVIEQSRSRMRAYAITGAEWIKVGIAILAIGMFSITSAGVVHKSFDIAFSGYTEVAEELPTERLLALLNKGLADRQPEATQKSAIKTPIEVWLQEEKAFSYGGEYLARLEFDGAKWNVVKRPIAKTQKGEAGDLRDGANADIKDGSAENAEGHIDRNLPPVSSRHLNGLRDARNRAKQGGGL